MKNAWALCSLIILAGACVPKQQFDDQQTRLKETQDKLKEVEANASECDPNAFLQLKEQSQSLDLLTQELVDRNTELSKEVARLRVVETEFKAKDKDYADKTMALEKDFADKEARLRRTYEDLIKELRGQIRKLEDAAAKSKEAPKKESPKTSKSTTKAPSSVRTAEGKPSGAKPQAPKGQ